MSPTHEEIQQQIDALRLEVGKAVEQEAVLEALLAVADARAERLEALITTGADQLEAIITNEWADAETRNAAVRLWRRDLALSLEATP